MVLSALGKSSVCLVSSQITKACPFQNKSTEAGNGVVDVTVAARRRVEDYFVIGDTTWGVKGDAESVCKSNGCCEKVLCELGVFHEMFVRA